MNILKFELPIINLTFSNISLDEKNKWVAYEIVDNEGFKPVEASVMVKELEKAIQAITGRGEL